MKAYIAGRLWEKNSRYKLEKINALCEELGIDTFLPHRDVGIFKGDNTRFFFNGDSKAIDKCNVMIAILDWKYIGSGTAWEIGYAYAKKIPVIGIIEDIKSTYEPERVCVMVFNSVDLVDSIESLRDKLIALKSWS